jgi:hypothetical protein
MAGQSSSGVPTRRLPKGVFGGEPSSECQGEAVGTGHGPDGLATTSLGRCTQAR